MFCLNNTYYISKVCFFFLGIFLARLEKREVVDVYWNIPVLKIDEGRIEGRLCKQRKMSILEDEFQGRFFSTFFCASCLLP